MKNLWKTWNGSKLTADLSSNLNLRGDYLFHKEAVGPDGFMQKVLNDARATAPLANGHIVKKIHHLNTFKAAEWQDFLEVYGISLFHENLE